MSSIKNKYYYTDFRSVGPMVQDDGTVASATAAETNLFTVDGIPWGQYLIGANTAMTVIPTTTRSGLGLDFKTTDTNGLGAVYYPYANTKNSPLAFTIGTDPAFFMELVVQGLDWSGARLMAGFHGGAAAAGSAMQAHQTVANFANYTDIALIGNVAGGATGVSTQQCINTAGITSTGTGISLTDDDVAKLRVNVSAAGVVTYALSTAPTATPTTFTVQTITTTAFTFDSTDVVVPMILHTAHTDTWELGRFISFECGYQHT